MGRGVWRDVGREVWLVRRKVMVVFVTAVAGSAMAVVESVMAVLGSVMEVDGPEVQSVPALHHTDAKHQRI